MENYTETPQKVGRPAIYQDPVDVWVRMDKSMRDEIKAKFPGASLSRAVVMVLGEWLDDAKNNASANIR